MWKHSRTREADASTLPRHNGSVDRSLLAAALPLPPKPHPDPRRDYHTGWRYARSAKPMPRIPNTERYHELPTEPRPAREARADHVFAGIAAVLTSDMCLWTSRDDIERSHNVAMGKRDASLIERRAVKQWARQTISPALNLPGDRKWNR